MNTIINAFNIKNATISGLKNVTYTGSEITPAINVILDDKVLKEGTDYTVYYVKNINVGTATVLVTGEGNFDGVRKATFAINKANNTLTAKGKTATIKFTKLKKKNQTVTVKNAFTVSKAKGKVTYKKTGGSAKITVSSAGKITVKKGLKKATYKITVLVKASGNSNYKAGSKKVTVTIKVK